MYGRAKIDLLQARLIGATQAVAAARVRQTQFWMQFDRDGVVANPKASKLDHVRQNRAAHDMRLIPADLQELARAFPPPTVKRPLEMI